mgnify:CR=1 FL=1
MKSNRGIFSCVAGLLLLLPLCGLGDKTVLLAGRFEHHFTIWQLISEL